jgi:hypothetical protein
MVALRASFMGESEMSSAGIASRMALHNSRYRRGIKQQSYGDAPHILSDIGEDGFFVGISLPVGQSRGEPQLPPNRPFRPSRTNKQ